MKQAAIGPLTRVPRLTQPGVLLIDAQPGFLDSMHGDPEPVLARLEHLLLMADCLRLPTVATFEAPDASGWLPARLEDRWPAHGVRFVKETFDCCGQPEVAAALQGLGRHQLLVAGAQTDVCVLQSVLSLRERGYEVFFLEDCLASSETHTRPVSAANVQRRGRSLHAEDRLLRTEACGGRAAAPAGSGWERLMQLFGSPKTCRRGSRLNRAVRASVRRRAGKRRAAPAP